MIYKPNKVMSLLIKTTCIVLLTVNTSAVYSQTLNAGLRFQKTNGMYWENGISVQYAFANFKPDRFMAGFDYVSSRFGSALNTNAIKQDNYLFSATWLFNKTKDYHIFTRLNMGYFYSDLESEIFKDVPNTSFLFSPELGIKYNFTKLPLSVNLGSGFYLITAEDGFSPGTLQPLYYHLDLHYTLFKSKTNE